MPPKQNDKFFVVFLNEEVKNLVNSDDKILAVPASYVKDCNKVRYMDFPLSQDDRELMNSFLNSKNVPPPPASWATYSCLVLAAFGEY